MNEVLRLIAELRDLHWGCTDSDGDLEAGCSLWIELDSLLEEKGFGKDDE